MADSMPPKSRSRAVGGAYLSLSGTWACEVGLWRLEVEGPEASERSLRFELGVGVGAEELLS